MARIARYLMIAGLITASVAVFGCRTVIVKKDPAVTSAKSGPPPHAPAHGYRHKHADGVKLVYDSGLGVYLVSGHVDVYYYKSTYYRVHKGVFQSGKHIKGPWYKSSHKKVPNGLQKKLTKHNNKGKGKKS